MMQTSSWSQLLTQLDENYDRLKEEKNRVLMSQINGPSLTSPFSYFQATTEDGGPYMHRVFFNWKNFLEIEGTCCIHQMRDLFTSLVFYDAVVVQIFPVPFEDFNQFHPFSRSEFRKVRRLSENGRVVFWLTSPPSDYETYDYLHSLFEGAKVAYVPWNVDGIVDMKAWEPFGEYEQYTERYVEKPSVAEAIQRSARSGAERFQVTEAEVLVPLQDIRLLGLSELEEAVWKMLESNPDQAVSFLHSIRRLLINPIRYGSDIVHCWDKEKLQSEAKIVGPGAKLPKITIPHDIGGLLQERIVLPAPNSWDSVRWCDDHLDLQTMRAAIRSLELEVAEGGLTTDTVDEYRAKLDEAWRRQVASVQVTRQAALWTTTLSLGAAGALAAGPVTGLLAGLGLAAVANVITEPVSNAVATLLSRNSIHAWKLDQRRLAKKKN